GGSCSISLEHMKPDATRAIYQTMVWTTPSYRSSADQSASDGLPYAGTLDGPSSRETDTMTTDSGHASSLDDVARLRDRVNELTAANERLTKEVAELRQTERALRANELNFQLTVDSMPGMVHTMTAAGAVEFVNRQILDFFGKPVEELERWDMLLHPDDRSRVVDLWTHSVATGEPFDVEVRALRADGTYRWLHSRALPLRDTNGNIVRWHNLLTDIDDRKRAEAELRRAYDHLAEAQRLSQTGSFTSDLERDEHFWSDEFYRICDFELGSPVTIQRLGSIVHPEDVALYEGAIGRAMA